jgi:hypothetical protein
MAGEQQGGRLGRWRHQQSLADFRSSGYDLAGGNVHDMSNGGNDFFKGLLIIVYIFAQPITYVMAMVRWFSTHHDTFWYGFKELVWALAPVANFAYVWDWWVGAFLFVAGLFHR